MALQSLARAAGDYVTLVQLIRQAPADRLPPVGELREQLLELLDEFNRDATEIGIDEEEIRDARFALAVWADESALRAEWPGREEWHRELLQSRLYRTTRGGNEFYERLGRLDSEHHDAREVFVLAMLLGFEGQYAGQTTERSAIITQQIRSLRAGSRGLDLSVDGPFMPSSYDLDIEIPTIGGLSLPAILGIGAGALVALYLFAWLILYLVAGEVPLPAGVS